MVQSLGNLSEDPNIFVLLHDSVRRRARLIEEIHKSIDRFLDNRVGFQCPSFLTHLNRVILDITVFVVRLVGHVVTLWVEHELHRWCYLVSC